MGGQCSGGQSMCKGPGQDQAGPGRGGGGGAGCAGPVGLGRTAATWAFNPEGGGSPGGRWAEEGREGPLVGARRSPATAERMDCGAGLCRCRWVMAGAGACAPSSLDPFFTFA